MYVQTSLLKSLSTNMSDITYTVTDGGYCTAQMQGITNALYNAFAHYECIARASEHVCTFKQTHFSPQHSKHMKRGECGKRVLKER